MQVVFSMGKGHNGTKPEAWDVMNCLAMDATTEDTSFEDWCAELGYDSNSRKAERVFCNCQAQTVKLLNFLGRERTMELVYKVERL